MGFYERGLGQMAAVCVGATSVVFGALPQGAVEVGIGIAGLAGFVIGKSQKFGPECERVRKDILNTLLKDYRLLIKSDGGSWSLNSDLDAAHRALLETLEDCFIDRSQLAKSAVTPRGFPETAVKIMMAELGKKRPDLFSEENRHTLSYRYATDVVRAGIKSAVENAEYYKALEPEIMFEMASALGEVREDVKSIKTDLTEIKDHYSIELNQAKESLHASETELSALLSFILKKPVPKRDIVAELKQSYSRLSELQERLVILKQQTNDRPEIRPFLDQVEISLRTDEFFSLDEAEGALIDADLRYSELFPDREEFGLAIGYFHFFLRHVLRGERSALNQVEDIDGFVVIVPSSFKELGELRGTLEATLNDLGLSLEHVEVDSTTRRKMILHKAGPYLIDFPSSLSASASSPRYERIQQAISLSSTDDRAQLEAKLTKLETVIIGSFFSTLNEIIRSTFGIDLKRIECITLVEFLSRLDPVERGRQVSD